MSEQIVLEDELLDHLATPEGAMAIFRERLSVDVLPRDCEAERKILQFVYDYISEYGSPPGGKVLTAEFGVPFETPTTDVEYVVSALRKRHVRNEAQEVLLRGSRAVGEDPLATVDAMMGELTHIKQEAVSKRYSLSQADWSAVYEGYKERVAAGFMKGITFGFSEMDDILGGLRPKTLTYIIGRPKRYKSWFLLKSAVEAFLQGSTVSLWSLELPAEEMYGRFQCMVAGVGWSRYQKGILFPDEEKRMVEAADMVGQMPNHFHIHAPRNGATVAEIRQQSLDDAADIVYIDQLSWLRHTERVKADLRHMEVEYINRDLKTACDDFPILIAAQFNRQADSVEEMADLSKIGLSDSIGQTADMILGLYRNKEMGKNHLIEYGTIESRGFEQARFEIKVNLSRDSNFDLLSRIDGGV